jgi:hypothetical protein
VNRREFLKMLGVTATLVAFPRAIWTPKTKLAWDDGIILINPKCREDLLEIIQNIAPMDTLYLSEFSKVPPHNVRYEWSMDGLEL